MSDWGRKVDVTKTLTTNLRVDNFNATLVTHDTAVLHALVLTANTLEISDWSEDLCTEQSVAFRFERTVVDSFRLFNFAVRPATDLFR